MLGLVNTVIFVIALNALVVRAYMPNYIVVTRQDSTDTGFLETIDGDSGHVVCTSNISFSFTWPYVQMTTDVNHNVVYALTIPKDGIPRIYAMQSVVNMLSQKGYWTILDGTIIFDLQYAMKKDTLFGIKVTGKYQRTLSNIVLGPSNTMQITELYNLPEYWYVNASSYDGAHDIYFALINNFPGREESTSDQQLLIVDFSSVVVGQSNPSPSGKLVPIEDTAFGGQMQFIAYDDLCRVFAGGINLQTNVAYVALLNLTTGKTTDLNFQVANVTEIGPLVMHSNHGTTGINMNFFVKHGSNNWTLYMLQYNTNAKYINVIWTVRNYSGDLYKSFAAATVAFEEY